MSTPTVRSLVLAGVCGLALLVGPTSALGVSKTEKAQNSAIQKARASAARAGKSATSAGALAKSASAAATAAGAQGSQAGADAKKANDGIDVINGLLGPALSAITGFRVELQSLQNALELLTASVRSDEHGVVQIAFGSNATPIPGCFYESGDIPDDLQSAIVTGTCLVPDAAAPASTTPVPAGAAVHILAGIRSNESDGTTSPAVDAGVAGIVAYSQVGAVAGGNTTNDGGIAVVTPLGGGSTIAAGAGSPPAVPIPLKSQLSTTDVNAPFSTVSTDHLVDLATTQFSGTPATPMFGAANSRSVTFTVRFNDLTADAANPTS